MLMAIGFLILTRLSFTKAVKQFTIAVGAMMLCIRCAIYDQKDPVYTKNDMLYAVVGLLALLIVAILGAVSYGAKISYTVAGISLQPSEFVKIIFVFFVAGMFHQSNSFRQVVITTVVAAAHVIVLVASKDLGGALIFFVVYITMLYVATGNPFYFIGGLLSGSVAAVIAYRLFSHVRVRVVAWQDPISVIDNEGYQICRIYLRSVPVAGSA